MQSSTSFRIVEFIFRFFCLFVAGWAGNSFGVWAVIALGTDDEIEVLASRIVFMLIGGLAGFILIPYVTTRPARAIRVKLGNLSAETLFAGLLGLIVGLLTAALLSFPISLLPPPFGEVLPFISVVAFSYFGISLFVMRQGDLLGLISTLSGRSGSEGGSSSSWTNLNRTILLDTSVIIDGRVSDVAKTGFLPGTLLIPRFVLNELQYIADSPDGLRRQRGRRGMEVLAELQKIPSILVRISDINAEGVREVDDKLVVLARQLKCPILTNDFNLNKVAELQGVTILNINELANAVKSVVLPAEHMTLNIFQEGKEHDQGVGYMDDGTMVVVENGHNYIGEYKEVVVTKVLQTAAGRMIFARVEDANGKKK
jgi:uncharacterized protein YacL